MGNYKKKMTTIKNILFIISVIIFSNLIYDAQVNMRSISTKNIWNSDSIGTSNENGKLVYAKNSKETWSEKAMETMKEEEMTGKAVKELAKIPTPTSWFALIYQMAFKITAMSKTKATERDWELLALEEKVLTIRLAKMKAIDAGG